MALDALFFGAHPDDVELTSGGLAALLAAHGHGVGVVDLTRGEAASRGTVEERARESEEAARALGIARRLNLRLPDLGLDARDRSQQVALVECLRSERPRLVVAPEAEDVHPDHVEASRLVARACYLAGLARFQAGGERFRPGRLLFALYRSMRRPHLVVDITSVWSRRLQALRAHQSQLGSGPGPATYLTRPEFVEEVESRARGFGAAIGVRYGEGYRSPVPFLVEDARVLLPGSTREPA
ncbi:MAG TPA: bacillithiol biosynthesis deacetylase BshB1 [Candidatus Eisenbacteria bacterium]|jgi:bacillithiol biosynthesis deacetylase BshB1